MKYAFHIVLLKKTLFYRSLLSLPTVLPPSCLTLMFQTTLSLATYIKYVSTSFISYHRSHNTRHKLIPFDGDANLETNPYITVTGCVSKFDSENRSFTMTPTQYIILTHSTSPFPIHADFADSTSKKRWGTEGPRVVVGSSITFGGFLQRVVREHNIDKPLQFAQVEVANIAYLGSTRSNFSTSQIRTYPFSQHPQ